MGIEEKAKAYDEAMERAREFYNSKDSSATMKLVALNIFPELRESEDEKARKWLTNLVENLGDPADEDAEKELEVMRPLALSYLEKQKEQSLRDFIDDFPYSDQKEQKPAEWSEEDEAMLDSVIRIITRFDDLAYEPTFAGPKWTHPYTKELNFLEKLRNRLFEEND